MAGQRVDGTAEFEGRRLDALRGEAVFGPAMPGRDKALAQAIEQIDRARASATVPTGGAPPQPATI